MSFVRKAVNGNVCQKMFSHKLLLYHINYSLLT